MRTGRRWRPRGTVLAALGVLTALGACGAGAAAGTPPTALPNGGPGNSAAQADATPSTVTVAPAAATPVGGGTSAPAAATPSTTHASAVPSDGSATDAPADASPPVNPAVAPEAAAPTATGAGAFDEHPTATGVADERSTATGVADSESTTGAPAHAHAHAPAAGPLESGPAQAPETGTGPPAQRGAAAAPSPKPAPQTGTVVVQMTRFESDRGQARVAIFRSKQGFPDKRGRAFAGKVVAIRKGRARAVFRGVPPGDFAVAAHHDADADGKMDKNLLGIPTEGFGTSRDAPASFGPPSYDDARLSISRGQRKRVVVTMRY